MLSTRNFKVLEIVDVNKPIITPALRKDLWKKRAETMVKTLKESASSQWAAPILLGLLLSYGIYASHQADLKQVELTTQLASIQRDLLVLQTQKDDERHQREIDRQNSKDDSDVQRVWRENLNNKMSKLELIVQGRFPTNNNHSNGGNQ